ncbi:general stress protein [Arthrobacter sp. 260]|uniref:general stress protein n=1 Tax=Arthrobacter sp. 260 TaxID=2735314 RepID=UPI001C11887B|nr:general stress protein [Arthrobacter sp. 260]
MSNVLGRTASRDESRILPKGETVGRYSAYLDAQKAVDYLADSKFPVQKVSIIGSDLKTVERVTGRLSYPRVALASAATGAWFGFFVGLILTLFGDGGAYLPIITSMALGAVFWMLFGVITYAFQRGKRDFTSTSQVIATSYDVIVEPDAAGEARRMLQQLPMNGQSQHPGNAPQGWQPPAGGGQPPQQPTPPAAWQDPLAQPPRDSQPAAAQPGGPQSATGDPTPESGPRRGQFADLPDGRPQYGVRVTQPDNGQAPETTGTQEPRENAEQDPKQ